MTSVKVYTTDCSFARQHPRLLLETSLSGKASVLLLCTRWSSRGRQETGRPHCKNAVRFPLNMHHDNTKHFRIATIQYRSCEAFSRWSSSTWRVPGRCELTGLDRLVEIIAAREDPQKTAEVRLPLEPSLPCSKLLGFGVLVFNTIHKIIEKTPTNQLSCEECCSSFVQKNTTAGRLSWDKQFCYHTVSSFMFCHA